MVLLGQGHNKSSLRRTSGSLIISLNLHGPLNRYPVLDPYHFSSRSFPERPFYWKPFSNMPAFLLYPGASHSKFTL